MHLPSTDRPTVTMREANFSIPNVNKASVSITPTLYDRRALDCTSTLPLINSLNHLAYLTTSSARIREILTIDGGIEQLVCTLKTGRSREMMELWKWNLAFQCIVNIGVRGSEGVRTRLVEADVVPVVATILDNYVQVMEKLRAMEAEQLRASSTVSKPIQPVTRASLFERPSPAGDRNPRRHPPPSIEIPHNLARNNNTTAAPQATDPALPHRRRTVQPLATAYPNLDGFPPRPVRDADRLPSMVMGLQAGLVSQPESPITPLAAAGQRNILETAPRRRPSLRQQVSLASTESDDANGEDVTMGDDMTELNTAEPIVGLQNAMEVDDDDSRESMLDDSSEGRGLAIPNPSEGNNLETFNITHHSPTEGSIINAAAPAGEGAIGLSPARPTANTTAPVIQQTPYPGFLRDRQITPAVAAIMPRDEDVLMALQLLAYVSKYTSLRTYFQQTHLVPKLKIGKDIQVLDDATYQLPSPTECCEDHEEYVLPDDFNVFPLVEKFTAKHYTKDMQYWACVVMRNLCRKDESKGGIRQCAWYKCGQWEETPRQFAKCRRCRRTKYCSKECQKSAWVYHRHWCQSSQQEQQQQQAPQPQPQSQPSQPSQPSQ